MKKTHEQFLNTLKGKNAQILEKIEILSEYNGKDNTLKCKCKKCEGIFYILPLELYVLHDCKLCVDKVDRSKNQRSNLKEFKEKVEKRYGDKIEFEIIGNYVNCRTPIKCRCLKDKNHIFERTPTKIMTGHIRCPICNKQTIIPKQNSIAITSPWMIEFLKDKEDANKYPDRARKKVFFKCPICGAEKELAIYQIYSQGFSCDFCKKDSFQNRILNGLMKELKSTNQIVNYKREFSPDWFDGSHYRYDGLLILENDNILLEFDGDQHTNKNNPYYSEERVKIDKVKDLKAKENGYKIIRINCIKSNFDYIKNNILNSELNSIFDLNELNWDNILKETEEDLLDKICNFYNEHLEMTIKDIAKELNISKITLNRYIKRGKELGKCKEKKIIYSNSIKVKVIDKNQKEIIFKTKTELYIFLKNNKYLNPMKLVNKYLNSGRYCGDYLLETI